MSGVNTWISRCKQRMAVAGLAVALLGAGAAPLLGGQDVAAVAYQNVTKSFSSTENTILVSGFEQGQIVDVNVTLTGFSARYADDIDVLIEHGSANLIVMSDAGGSNEASNLTVRFDDSAPGGLPDETALASGAFLPTNHLLSGADTFLAPAPVPSADTALAAFNGLDPNGAWQLYVNKEHLYGTASIASWEVQVTARVPVTEQQQNTPKAKAKDKSKDGKHKNGHGKGKGKGHGHK